MLFSLSLCCICSDLFCQFVWVFFPYYMGHFALFKRMYPMLAPGKAAEYGDQEAWCPLFEAWPHASAPSIDARTYFA